MPARLFSIVVVLSLLALPASATAKQDVLFDVIFDMDQNKVWDRAVLVVTGLGRTDFSPQTKDVYMLSKDEQVDLLIYLNAGDGTLDVSKPPTLRKEKVMDAEILPFVLPLKVNLKGSLQVQASNGFGNTFNLTETLTIVYRNGDFTVAGWAQDFYNSRDEQSRHCSVNYLTGKAVSRSNAGKNLPLAGNFKAVTLAQWSAAARPQTCDAE
jgi:hypothetical protein